MRPQSEQSDGDPRLDLTAITRRLKRDLKNLSALLVTLGQADKNGWYQGSLLVRRLPRVSIPAGASRCVQLTPTCGGVVRFTWCLIIYAHTRRWVSFSAVWGRYAVTNVYAFDQSAQSVENG